MSNMDVQFHSLRHEPDPVSLWKKDRGHPRKFNTQLRDLGYNALDIGSNATKLAAAVRYLLMNLMT